MKKITLSLFILLFSVSAWGTHVDGGQIYWTAVGNDQYVFTLQLLRNASPNSAGLSSSASIRTNALGLSSFSVTRKSVVQIAPACYNSTNPRLYELHTYTSNPITIAPPSTGNPWVFSYNLCCMPASHALNISNTASRAFHLEAKMFASGVNQSAPFTDLHSLLRKKYSRDILIPTLSKNGNPVTINLAPLKQGDTTFIPYKTGYSYQHPTSPTDTLLPSGWFISGYALDTGEAYLGFTLIEETDLGQRMAESSVSFGYSFDLASNSYAEPIITQNGSNTTVQQIAPQIFRVRGGINEHIQLGIKGEVDLGSATSNVTQISARMYSEAIQGASMPLPTLRKKNGNTNVLDTGEIEVVFDYILPTNFPLGTTKVVIVFEDHNCPINSTSTAVIEIENKGYTISQLALCEGATTTLNSSTSGQTYQWMPTTGISSPNSASTTLTVGNVNTYYLLVDGDTSDIYKVKINKTSTLPFARVNSYQQLELLNPNDYFSHRPYWFYLPMVAPESDTTYPLSHGGIYHIEAGPADCKTMSDSVYYKFNGRNYVSTITSFDYNRADIQLSPPTNNDFAIEVQFGTQDVPTVVDRIIIPAPLQYDSQDTARLIYTNNANGNSHVVFAPVLAEGIIFELNTPIIAYNTNYTITLSSKNGAFKVPTFEIFDYPTGHSHSSVTACLYSVRSAGGFTRNHLVPQVVFAGTTGIGLDENDAEFTIYPQPADEYIQVESNGSSGNFNLYNINGQVVSQGQLNGENRISCSDIPSGVYILKIESKNRSSSHKVLITH